jgi:hypothetical protein
MIGNPRLTGEVRLFPANGSRLTADAPLRPNFDP